MKKRIVSVILSLILVFASFSVLAFAEGDRLNYVVLGDSIAFGSGLLNPIDAVYGKIVADTDGYAYENYAVPGHTTKNLLSRMTSEKVSNAISEADIINISIGGNNFLTDNLAGLISSAIVKNDFSRFDEIAENFYSDFSEIVSFIRSLNSETAILIQTIYNPQQSYVGEVYQAGADRINAKIRAFSDENPGEVIVVDVASALTSPSDFASDGIHPSASGNEKIAVAVLSALAENGLGSETTPVIETKGVDVRGTSFMTFFVRLYGNFLHVISVIRNRIFAR